MSTARTLSQLTSFWGVMKADVISVIPEAIAGLIVFIIFCFIGIGAKWLISRNIKNRQKKIVLNFIGRAVKFLFIIIGLIIALGTVGVSVTSLVTSLGLVGFAVSYAMKDMLTNVMAGALIIFNNTIKVGDELTVGSNTGEVTNIDLRYTTLEAADSIKLIPNGKLLTETSSIAKAVETN